MARTSAGLLMYRWMAGRLEVLLVHPGGPYWRGKDEGAWSIPKGEYAPDEEPLAAARREFQEETGVRPVGPFLPLTPVLQPGGKMVHAWAFEGDCEPSTLRSNRMVMQWPPGSGQWKSFPEVDQGAWFSLEEATRKILKGQIPLLGELAKALGVYPG